MSQKIRNRRWEYLQKHPLTLSQIQNKFPDLYFEYFDFGEGLKRMGLSQRIFLKMDMVSGSKSTVKGEIAEEDLSFLKTLEKPIDFEVPLQSEETIDVQLNKVDQESMEETKDLTQDKNEELEELLIRATSLFINGLDPTFDYSSVDTNDAFDLVLEGDIQDAYFDRE